MSKNWIFRKFRIIAIFGGDFRTIIGCSRSRLPLVNLFWWRRWYSQQCPLVNFNFWNFTSSLTFLSLHEFERIFSKHSPGIVHLRKQWFAKHNLNVKKALSGFIHELMKYFSIKYWPKHLTYKWIGRQELLKVLYSTSSYQNSKLLWSPPIEWIWSWFD